MSSIITVFPWKTDLRIAALAALLAVAPGFAAADAGAPLAAYDVGVYAELAVRPNPEGHAIVFVPALMSVLAVAEQDRGAPLTESDVLAIRDAAGAIAVPAAKAADLDKGRGYADLHADRCWQEWQAARGRYFNQ